jgi:branched-chain amino acid transport system permease protein
MVLALQVATPLVVGLANGAAIGLVAIGLVLIYKSSHIFNFAAGEFVTIGAFGVYVANHIVGLPYPAAMAAGTLAGLLAGLLTEVLVVRPLSNRPKVTPLVATAAIAIVLIPIELIKGGVKVFVARPAFNKGVTLFGARLMPAVGWKVFGVYVSPQEMLVFIVLAVAGAVLAWFFARTDLGLATLATSQEPTASRLMGIRLNRVAMLTWGAAGLLGGLAGVLLPPVGTTFAAGYGTTFVLIPAFTGAVLGGMTSVPGAFVGSLLVGFVQSFAQLNFNKTPGANSIAILLVLVAVLLVRPTGLLGKEA